MVDVSIFLVEKTTNHLWVYLFFFFTHNNTCIMTIVTLLKVIKKKKKKNHKLINSVLVAYINIELNAPLEKKKKTFPFI